MRRRSYIVLAVLVLLPVVLLSVQSLRVHSILNEREAYIKEALRTADSDTLQSNPTDGAKRFLETGELVFEWSYLKNPQALRERSMFNMRVHPRVTTHRNDGWVGIYNENWYVKIP